jgi:hypothetical protein
MARTQLVEVCAGVQYKNSYETNGLYDNAEEIGKYKQNEANFLETGDIIFSYPCRRVFNY